MTTERDLIFKEYRNAVLNQISSGNSQPLKRFKEEHPCEYKLATTMYRKRTEINNSLLAMLDTSLKVYWFTLTFNDCKDKNNIESKRKDAQNFLNSMCFCYLMIEEYGEQNERYHIHGFLIFANCYDFNDFTKWHSRQNLVEIKYSQARAKTRYLTNYMSKSIPRIRRSKNLVKLTQYFKTYKGLRNNFKSTYASMFSNAYLNLMLQDAHTPF